MSYGWSMNEATDVWLRAWFQHPGVMLDTSAPPISLHPCLWIVQELVRAKTVTSTVVVNQFQHRPPKNTWHHTTPAESVLITAAQQTHPNSLKSGLWQGFDHAELGLFGLRRSSCLWCDVTRLLGCLLWKASIWNMSSVLCLLLPFPLSCECSPDWWLFQTGRCATCSPLQSARAPPFDILPSVFPPLVYSVIPPLSSPHSPSAWGLNIFLKSWRGRDS